jgi:hypothetical protein
LEGFSEKGKKSMQRWYVRGNDNGTARIRSLDEQSRKRGSREERPRGNEKITKDESIGARRFWRGG